MGVTPYECGVAGSTGKVAFDGNGSALMEPAADVTRMRLVGGNLALDFVNSCSGPPEGPPDDDALAGYADVVAWGRYAGTLSDAQAAALRRLGRDDPQAAAAAFDRCLRVRECLDEVFRPIATGGRPHRRGLAELRDHERDAIGAAELVAGDGYAWTWRRDRTLLRPVRPVVHAAVELLTSGQLSRIKGCRGCRFLFLDESRNGSRRWCSMEDCGTAEKMRRYVARRAGRA
jgi:predicted RNA-binding Zn ribbon-like protein